MAGWSKLSFKTHIFPGRDRHLNATEPAMSTCMLPCFLKSAKTNLKLLLTCCQLWTVWTTVQPSLLRISPSGSNRFKPFKRRQMIPSARKHGNCIGACFTVRSLIQRVPIPGKQSVNFKKRTKCFNASGIASLTCTVISSR